MILLSQKLHSFLRPTLVFERERKVVSAKNTPPFGGQKLKVLDVVSVRSSSGIANGSGVDMAAVKFVQASGGFCHVKKTSDGLVSAEISPYDGAVRLELSQHPRSGAGSFRLIRHHNGSEKVIDFGPTTNISNPNEDGQLYVSGSGANMKIWQFVCMVSGFIKPAAPVVTESLPQAKPEPQASKSEEEQTPDAPAPAPEPESEAEVEIGEPAQPPQILLIHVDEICPNEDQPRKRFRQASLLSLAESLRERQEEPIEVTAFAGSGKIRWKLVKGERRWRAAQLGKIPKLLAVIRTDAEVPDDQTRFERCLVSDAQREQYCLADLVNGLVRLAEMGRTHAQIAIKCNRDVSWVARQLSLGDLDPDLLKLVDKNLPREKQLPLGAARQLARLPLEKQRTLYEDVRRDNKGSRLQIQELEKQVKIFLESEGCGRKRKPSDYRRNFDITFPRMLADARKLNGWSNEIVASLATTFSAPDVESFKGELQDTIDEASTFLNRLIEAFNGENPEKVSEL